MASQIGISITTTGTTISTDLVPSDDPRPSGKRGLRSFSSAHGEHLQADNGWATEERLRCKGLAGVVGEATRLSLNTSRRLQLYAGESGVTALVIRRWRHAGDKEHVTEPNAAATRWRIAPSPSLPGVLPTV